MAVLASPVFYTVLISNSTLPESLSRLDALCDAWRANNLALGLTGALLHCDGLFVLVLEGEEANVTMMRERVVADPRHEDVRVLRETEYKKRRFPFWPLVYVGPSRWVSRALANRTAEDVAPGSAAEADFLIYLIQSFVGDPPLAPVSRVPNGRAA